MEGINIVEVVSSVGSVVGTPAACFLIYLWNKTKQLEEKVNKTNDNQDELRKDMETIKSDLSYIRGLLDERFKKE